MESKIYEIRCIESGKIIYVVATLETSEEGFIRQLNIECDFDTIEEAEIYLADEGLPPLK